MTILYRKRHHIYARIVAVAGNIVFSILALKDGASLWLLGVFLVGIFFIILSFEREAKIKKGVRT